MYVRIFLYFSAFFLYNRYYITISDIFILEVSFMDPQKDLSVIFGTSHQSIIDKIVQDASTPASGVNGRVPSRTTAYKAYSLMQKSQRKHQKKPQKKTPSTIIEK